MRKYIAILIISISLINLADCQSRDTAIFFFKRSIRSNYRTSTLDSCDFFRMILPPDRSDKLLNIKDFYKNGKLLSAGKSDYLDDSFINGSIRLQGDAISFFPDGKRSGIAHYTNGQIDRSEFKYFPNGKLYYVRKFTAPFVDDSYLECYDYNGTKICSNGNGRWKIYDIDFKTTLLEGTVSNGYMIGDWTGYVMLNSDSIKCVYKFNKSMFVSATSYDKTGREYPFTREEEHVTYKNGPFVLRDLVRKKIKTFKNIKEKKSTVDSLFMSFIVEKDGHLSELKILSSNNNNPKRYNNFVEDPELANALINAFANFPDWIPTKYYGIPKRSTVVIPLKFILDKTTEYFQFMTSWDIN